MLYRSYSTASSHITLIYSFFIKVYNNLNIFNMILVTTNIKTYVYIKA